MALAQTLGSRLKALREARGWTQAHLAELAGMTASEISRVECGAREPRFTTLEQLAQSLGVPPEQLFVDGSERPVQPARSRQGGYEHLLHSLPRELVDAAIRAAVMLSRAAAAQKGPAARGATTKADRAKSARARPSRTRRRAKL